MTTAIAPAEVANRIAESGDATYVDVRTVAEFVSGRPRGRAVNVPIVFHHPTTGADHDNEAFMLVIDHALEADTPIIVGDDGDGDRAVKAAAALVAAGREQVLLMTGGLAAWQASGLPVTGDNRDGVSYVSLLTPARRAQAK